MEVMDVGEVSQLVCMSSKPVAVLHLHTCNGNRLASLDEEFKMAEGAARARLDLLSTI